MSDVLRSALTRLLEDGDTGLEKLVLQRLEGIDKMIKELNTKLFDLTDRLDGVMQSPSTHSKEERNS